MGRLNMQHTSARVMVIGWVVALVGLSAGRADAAPPRARWIFRYDRSGEQPPAGRAQPDFVGVVTEVAETRTRQWGMRVRVETLERTQRTIMVTESTRIDGEPAKKAKEGLAPGVPLAVFGEEVRGAFRARALFVISEDDWREIAADPRREAGEGERAPREGWAEAPTGYQWPAGAEEDYPDVSYFPWPTRPWEARYAIPEVTAPEPARRSAVASPMERVRRADFSGTIRSIRSGGWELSVATPGAVIVVLLEEGVTVRRDGGTITPDQLREGDVVDVAVGRWRGTESCRATQLWVVTQGEAAAP